MDEYQRLAEDEKKQLEKLRDKFGFEEIEKKEKEPALPPEDLGVMGYRSVEARLNLDQQVEDVFMMDLQQAQIPEDKQLTVPSDEELYGEYNKEKFQEKKLHKSRESKIKNKKSRLYRKNRNASKMASFEEKEFKQRDTRAVLRRSMHKDQRLNMTTQDAKDISELAMLLGGENDTKEQIRARMEELTEQMSGVKTAEAVANETKRKSALETIGSLEKQIKEGKMTEVTGEDGQKKTVKKPLTEEEKKQAKQRIREIKEEQLKAPLLDELKEEKNAIIKIEKDDKALSSGVEGLNRELDEWEAQKDAKKEQLENEKIRLDEAKNGLKNIQDIVNRLKTTEKNNKKLPELLAPYLTDLEQKKKDIADSEKLVKKLEKEFNDVPTKKRKRDDKLQKLNAGREQLATHTAKLKELQERADRTESKYRAEREARKKEHRENREKGRVRILKDVAKAILKIDVSGINLFDDAQLADSQDILEKNRKLVDIYRRMAAEHPDFEKSMAQREEFKKHLDYLTAVSDLYRVRKLIVTNEYYKTHYNEELSMETDAHDTPAKKYLAKLLRTSFYLGKNLRMAADVKAGKVKPEPHALSLTAKNKKGMRDDEMGRRMSADASDWDELPEMKKILEKNGGLLLDRKARRAQLRKYEKERRSYTDNMLYTLEFEKDCIPTDAELVDLDKLANTKLTNKTIMTDSYLGKYDTLLSNLKQRDPEYRRRLKKYTELTEKNGTDASGSVGVKSERLKNFKAGDSILRSQYCITRGITEHMTDEEMLEYTENLFHSLMKPEFGQFSEEEQAAAEEMFLSEYKVYLEQIYAGSKWVVNVLGGALPFLHPEDMLKLLSNEKFRRKLITQATVSTNVQNEGPLIFMKTYGKGYMGHMDDIDPVCLAAGSVMIYVNCIRQMITATNGMDIRGSQKFEASMSRKIEKLDAAIGEATAEKQRLGTSLASAKKRYEDEPENSPRKQEYKTSVETIEKKILEIDEKIDQMNADKDYAGELKKESQHEHSLESFDVSMLHKKIYAPGDEPEWEGKDYWYNHAEFGIYYANLMPDYMNYRDSEGSDMKMYTEEEKKKYLDSLKSRGIYDANKKLREGYEKLSLKQRREGIDKNDKTWDDETRRQINTGINTSKKLTKLAGKNGVKHGGSKKYVQKSFYD